MRGNGRWPFLLARVGSLAGQAAKESGDDVAAGRVSSADVIRAGGRLAKGKDLVLPVHGSHGCSVAMSELHILGKRTQSAGVHSSSRIVL
jgi:hypothetical protein